MRKVFNTVFAGFALCSTLAIPAVAAADTPSPTTYTLKVVTVYGRRQLPSVVIEIARLSAAHEASVAHEELHRALLEQSMPPALRPQPAR